MTPALTLIALLGAPAELPSVAPPPMPSFRAPVDYLAWYREQMAFAADSNAANAYGPLLYENGTKPARRIRPVRDTPAQRQLRMVLETPKPWAVHEYPELNLWLAGLDRNHLGPLLSAVKYEHFAIRLDPKWQYLDDIKLPRFDNPRVLCQALIARGWRVVGRTLYLNLLMEAMGVNLAYAGHVQQGLTSAEYHIASGIANFIHEQVRNTMPVPALNVSHWRSLVNVVHQDHLAPWNESLARSLLFEEARTLERVQRFTRESEGGKKRFDVDAYQAHLKVIDIAMPVTTAVRSALADAEPDVLAAAAHAYFDKMRKVLTGPPDAPLNVRLKKITKSAFDSEPGLRGLVLPLDLKVKSAMRAEANRRMMHLYLHGLIAYLDNETWPKSIGDLTCPDLASIRIDPYTGRDFLTAKAKRGWLLYSVGADGADNKCDELRDVPFLSRPPR